MYAKFRLKPNFMRKMNLKFTKGRAIYKNKRLHLQRLHEDYEKSFAGGT